MGITLRDAVVLVTGASGGIGSATARAFARHGANLVLTAPFEDRSILDALAAEAESFGVKTLVVPADLRDRGQIDAVVAAAVRSFGVIDALANIAGIGSSPALADSTDGELERVLAINLLGAARAMHAVLPHMKRRGRGSIVNVGSIAGESGVMGIYSASKFGLRGLNDSVRREVRSFGISVSLVEPGFVRTPMNAAMSGLPGPEVVADAIVRVTERPRLRTIVPRRYLFAVMLVTAFPALTDVVFGNARIQQRLNRDARAARAASAWNEQPS